MTEAGRRPVVLVSGNMGRNDGVDYSDWFRRDFPDVTFHWTEGKPEVLEAHIAEADAVIGDVPERLLARATKLRWVSSTGAGANGVSTPAFQAHAEIVATTVTGVHVASVPEQTLAMLLAFARRLPEQIVNQHGAHRYYWPTGLFEVEGQTMGILGLGKIGQSLARKAKGLGMRVVAWRRSAAPAPERTVDRLYARDDLHAMLAAADHVVITLPLTAETRGLFGAAELVAMKRTAYLYNVGRGPILDQDALITALRGGTIAGAGLDVTDPEPLPPDHPLWDAPNLILLTHYGGLTPKYGPRAYAILSENLRRFLAGEDLLNVVNKQRGY